MDSDQRRLTELVAELSRRDTLRLLALAGMGSYALSAGAENPQGGNDRRSTLDEEESLSDWSAFVDLLKPAAELNAITLSPEDDHLRAELYRQFVMNIALGYFVYFQTDPRFPDWIPFLNSAFLLQPNPDDVYHTSRLDDGGVYRVTGNRGTVHILMFSLGHEIMGMSDRVGGSLDQFEADELSPAPDGSFEFVLSAERPRGHQGYWRKMPKGTKSILVRQRSYDWAGEVSARLAIERLDVPPGEIKPRMEVSEIAARLHELMGGYVERLSRLWIGYQNRVFARMTENTVEITDFGGSLPQQAYLQGVYRFEADEAVILDTEIPPSHRYWNFQIADSLWNAVDFVHRQSSLNGHQARLDSDGRFRGVIALEDPGVPNWLDSGGYTTGMIIGRWFGADRHPVPSLKRIKLAEVRKHLPAGTPVVSPVDRHEQIRRRRIGAQLRRRW